MIPRPVCAEAPHRTKGLAFVVDCTQAQEFAFAHWLVNGADGGRLFVRCFAGDGAVRENVPGDVLASLTTMIWNVPSKSWTGGATMADSSLNRRVTVRLGDAVAFAQVGIVGLDGQIELEALRLHGLPEAAPALLCDTPTLPVGRREFAVETALDLPSLAAARSTSSTCRDRRPAGDHGEVSLASSTRFNLTLSRERTTPSACWRATCRAAPSTSALRRCPWLWSSGGAPEPTSPP